MRPIHGLRSAAQALCLAIAFLAPAAQAAGPYPTNMCVGTRNGSLGCSANDVSIAEVRITNGVTSCLAGTVVDIGIAVLLQSNAGSRYDVGVFVAKDGKLASIPVADGGSADCAVYGVPTGPAPLANLNNNACGDIQSSSQPALVDLGIVSVLCVPDQNGRLKLPATITWEQNANGTCQSPPAAWVEAGGPSKCNASSGIDIAVQVNGSLTIVKQTLPSATAGSFAFGATGATPASFSLSHGQQRVLTTGALSTSPTTVVVTESLLAGWDPTADIACTTADGGPASFVTIDKANRRITASLTAANSRATCTYTNKAQSSIRVVKAATGGDDTFAFGGDVPDFSIVTSSGGGERVISGLAAGRYAITEIVPAGWTLNNIACTDPSGGTTVSVPGKTATVDLAVGETVTCTFTNTKTAPPPTGVINVVKTTTGGNGSFPFTAQIGGAQSFTLATSGGTSPAKTFTGLAAGTYTVTEVVPAGWSLASITCADPTNNSSGAGATATINLAAGETVTCTFNNRANASVIIDKVATGGDATFNFTGTSAFSITTSSGNGRDDATFASVAAGAAVTITETVPAGWLLATAACRDATTSAPVGSAIANGVVVTPAAGQQVICTFTNGKAAQLTIVEVSTPKAGQAFAYTATGTGLANFSLTDDGSGNNKRVFTGLAPGGSYTVAQAAVAGWTTTAIQCSDRLAINSADRTGVDLATRTVTPNLQPGESLTCTFYNEQAAAGTIDVVKNAIGGDGSFAFANSGGSAGSATNPAAFTITTSSGSGSQQLSSLLAGTYTITETVPSGWVSPPAVQCAVLSGTNTTFTPVAGGIRISLGTTGSAVDSARCTFENTKVARITIVEDAQPDATQAFAYAAAGAGVPASFSLVNDGSAAPADRQSFPNLAAGAYRFTATSPSGWRLKSINCTGNSTTTVDVATGQANVTLAAGEDVTCTYRHQKDGSLTIVKSATGAAASDRFTFTGPGTLAGNYAAGESRTATLAPGNYVVTEIVPGGWSLTNIACTGGQWSFTGAPGGMFAFEPGDTTANITIGAGEAVSCTFTNTKSAPPTTGTINILKTTAGGNGSFPFTAQVGSAQSFTLATSGGTSPTKSFTGLAAGTYTVTEAVPTGWTLSSITCADPTGNSSGAGATATINLADGETVTCTFANTKLAQLTVSEVSTPKSPQVFAYTSTGSGLANFSLLDDGTNTGNTRVFANLVPGQAYTVTQGAVAGWATPLIVCSDRNAIAPGDRTPVDGANRSISPSLQPGENLTCMFANVQGAPGSIAITKTTLGGDGSFAFANSGGAAGSTTNPSSFTITTASGGGSRSLTGLAPGTYTITEAIPAGWLGPASVQCTVQSGSSTTITPVANGATIALGQTGAAVDSVSCSFGNTRAAGITIVEDAIPDSAQAFAYAATGTGVPASFSLMNDGTPAPADRRAFSGLGAGAYRFTAVSPAGWPLTAISCTGSSGTTVNVATGQADVTLSAGEDVTCTFSHTKSTPPATGTINVVKTATGGNSSFPFTAQVGGAQSFTLTTSAGTSPAKSFSGLAAGTYTVTELVPAGWTLSSITCADPTGNSSGAGATATINLADGETVTCTFANTATAGILVEKVSLGGDQTFAFSGTASFSITTASGAGRDATTFSAIAAGSPVTIVETVPTGWVLTGAACRDAATSSPTGTTIANGVRVSANAGQQVICTFTNTKLAQLAIVEVSSPKAPQSFAYTTTGPGLADFSLTDDGSGGNRRVFTDLVPGQAYSVAQAAVAGWKTTLILCSDRIAIAPGDRTSVDLAGRTVLPSLQPGERLLCSFINAQIAAGTIDIAKVASGGDDAFAFANSGGVAGSTTNPAAFGITTTAGGGSRSLTGLAPGTYTITEALPAGWLAPASVQCSVLAGTSTTITPVANGVTVRLGQTGLAVDSVACTFDNTKGARITIVEDAVPDAPQAFAYSGQGAGVPATFSLTNDGSPAPADRVLFDGLGSGAYRFTVTNPAGWRVTSIACSGNDGASTSVPAGQASVTVAPGDDVTCTFRHAREATITITKNATGAAAGDTFTFTGPAGLAGDYTAGQTRSATVLPGVHAVAEIVPAGWTLANIACTGGTVQYTGAATGATDAFELGDNTANIRIAAGEAVACTFSNATIASTGGTIVVRKDSVGGAGIFAFTGVEDFQIDTRQRVVPEYQIAVPPGTHVVQEIVPAGWRLTGLACTGTSTVDPATAKATVTIAAGQRVRCVFTDEKLGRIEIIKAIRGEKTGDFSFAVPPALDASQRIVLTPAVATGSAARLFENVPTGTYVVSEDTPPSGFGLFTLDCVDPTANSATSVPGRTATINLAPGETVSCTYLNVTTATIVVAAVSFQGQGRFGFTAESNPGKEVVNFTIDTEPFNANAGIGTRSRSDLLPVVYTITALPAPAGWTFTNLQCVSTSGEQHWTITGGTATITLPDGETIRCYYFFTPSAGVLPSEPVAIPALTPAMSLLLVLLIAASGGFIHLRARSPKK